MVGFPQFDLSLYKGLRQSKKLGTIGPSYASWVCAYSTGPQVPFDCSNNASVMSSNLAMTSLFHFSARE